MTFSSTSADSDFRCPVCRAAQPLQETCRRCRADLRLVMQARRRVDYLQQALADSAADDESKRQLLVELQWLTPGKG